MIRAMSTYYSPPPEPPARPVDPRPVDSPDPGSLKAGRIAAILTIVLMLVVVAFNQLGGKEPPARPETGQATVQPPDPSEPFALTAKFMVKMAHSWGFDKPMRAQVMASLVSSAKSEEDRVRLSMVAADLVGP